MSYALTTRFIKRLVVMYNNLNGTNPVKLKDLLSIGLSVPTSYKIIRLLIQENIVEEAEDGYKVDWGKFKQYIEDLIR